MSMEFIRRNYRVPARRGGRVRNMNVDVGEVMLGTIVGSRDQYLRIRWDCNTSPRTHHPTDGIVYLDGRDA